MNIILNDDAMLDYQVSLDYALSSARQEKSTLLELRDKLSVSLLESQRVITSMLGNNTLTSSMLSKLEFAVTDVKQRLSDIAVNLAELEVTICNLEAEHQQLENKIFEYNDLLVVENIRLN